MVSKNNVVKRLEENSEQRPHFAIRKLSIGAASVLIGLSFLGLNHQTVKADTNAGSDSENGNAASGDVDKSTQAVSSIPDKVVVETNSSSSVSTKKSESTSAQTSATDSGSEETESSKSSNVINSNQDLKIDSAKLEDAKISKNSLAESKVSVPSASSSASAASAKVSNSSISEDEAERKYPENFVRVTREVTINFPDGYKDKDGSTSFKSEQTLRYSDLKGVDSTTGKVLTYDTWKSDSGKNELDAEEVPKIDGYSPLVDGKAVNVSNDGNYYVPAASITVDGKNKPTITKFSQVTVSYQANQISNEIDFVDNVDSDDKEKQIVGTQTVQGKTDEIIKLSLDGKNNSAKLSVPEGYEIVPGTNFPTRIPLRPKAQPLEVYVQKNDRKLIINYVSDQQDNSKGKIVGNQTVNGKSGQTVKFTLEVPNGWEAVSGTRIPDETVTFGNVDSSPQTVYIQHKIDTTYAANHENDNDLYRTVTRTIEATQSGEKQSQIGSETRTFYRNKSYDEVTKKTTYTDWQSANSDDNSNNYSSFSLPYLEGYIVSAQENGRPITVTISNNQAILAAENAVPNQTTGPIDRTIVVTYTQTSSSKPNNPDNTNHDQGQGTIQTINLIDSDGQIKPLLLKQLPAKLAKLRILLFMVKRDQIM